jgi:hypothetical protein
MTGDEADEVLGIVRRIGPVVLSTALSTGDDAGSMLRRAVGMMVVDRNMTVIQVFTFVLGSCLDLARQCDATLVTMDRVRKAALEEKPLKLPGILTVNTIIRLTLSAESRIIARMTFRSREEVEKIAAVVNEAFEQTETIAADTLDQGIYLALIALHGTVVQHLATQGRLLPRVILYKYQQVMSALRMSHRAYATANRYRELIDENEVVHPAFMPMEGKMLAV